MRIIYIVGLFAISLADPKFSGADIYRFVTVDGVETFTDAPVDKGARIIIKGTAKQKTEQHKIKKTEKTHEISLDEIAEKTVVTSLNPQTASAGIHRLPAVGGVITSGVGMRTDPVDGKWRHHNGIDIGIPEGTPVSPASAGRVVYSGQRSGYGNTVVIEHDNSMVTLYGHNSRLLVTAGQTVQADSVIALSGNTGRSTGPHLHFEAWQSGTNITPYFMPGNSAPLPPVKLAANRQQQQKTYFRKEVMSDGSILFTNMPPAR